MRASIQIGSEDLKNFIRQHLEDKGLRMVDTPTIVMWDDSPITSFDQLHLSVQATDEPDEERW